MHKKPPTFRKNKTTQSSTQKAGKVTRIERVQNNESPRVLSLIGKLEKKTEKQMAGFVKELVRLKKQQVKLEQKLVKTKDNTVKTSQKKISPTPAKKKKVHKFKVVENKPRLED